MRSFGRAAPPCAFGLVRWQIRSCSAGFVLVGTDRGLVPKLPSSVQARPVLNYLRAAWALWPCRTFGMTGVGSQLPKIHLSANKAASRWVMASHPVTPCRLGTLQACPPKSSKFPRCPHELANKNGRLSCTTPLAQRVRKRCSYGFLTARAAYRQRVKMTTGDVWRLLRRSGESDRNYRWKAFPKPRRQSVFSEWWYRSGI